MPRLSIVIPWIGPSGPFEDTLAAVLQNRPSGSEVLVALAQPYDDPYGLNDEVTFVVSPGSDLVSLVNRAVEASTAPIIEVVPCGMLVTEGWTSAALLHFADPDIAAVAPAIVSSQNPQQVLAAGVNLSKSGVRQLAQAGQKHDVTRLVQTRPLAAPLTGGFFRKSVLTALGGFDATLGATAADLDFALCAAALELRTECEPTSVLTTSQRLGSDGSLATGRQLEQLFWRHLPAEQRRDRVTSHYLQCAAELGYACVQPWWLAHATGRALGWLTARGDAATAERIAKARESLAANEESQILAMPVRRSTHDGQRTVRRAA